MPESVRVAPNIESSGIQRLGDAGLPQLMFINREFRVGNPMYLKKVTSNQQQRPLKQIIRNPDSKKIPRSPKVASMGNRRKSKHSGRDTTGQTHETPFRALEPGREEHDSCSDATCEDLMARMLR